MFPLFLNAGSASKVLGVEVYGNNGKWVKPIYNVFYFIDRRIVWPLKYRFVKKHQYHLVDTKLKPAYYDIDHLMLHANMALLCRYVEIERGGADKLQDRVDYLLSDQAKIDYEHTPDDAPISSYADADIEALRIYNWWKHEHQANWDKHDEMLRHRYSGKMRHERADAETEERLGMGKLFTVILPDIPEGAPTHEELWAFERKLKQDEEDNLISVIKMRGALWT